jgi:hypothetical protein
MEMVLNVAVNHGITQFWQGVDNSWWNILGCKFEHTLEVRTFNRHSVTPTSSMPSTTFYEFQNAPHPVIMNATFPCPSEWKFSEGERVVVVKPSEKRGIIIAMHPHLVEVDLKAGEGIANVPWSNLKKYVVIGDFAEVTSRALCGEKGWVIEISGDNILQITERLGQQDISGGIAAAGRGSIHHNILVVGIQPNFATNH